jgi:hypothetical protein
VGESTARNLLTALLHAFRGEIDLSTLDPFDALTVLSGLDRSTTGVHETLSGWADRAEADMMERDAEEDAQYDRIAALGKAPWPVEAAP